MASIKEEVELLRRPGKPQLLTLGRTKSLACRANIKLQPDGKHFVVKFVLIKHIAQQAQNGFFTFSHALGNAAEQNIVLHRGSPAAAQAPD